MLSPEEQQFGVAMMLADHVYGPIVFRQAIADRFPRFTIIGRHIDVDIEIVAAMAVKGRVSGAFSVTRSDHSAYICPLGNTFHFFSNIFPVLSSIAGDLEVSIVCTHP